MDHSVKEFQIEFLMEGYIIFLAQFVCPRFVSFRCNSSFNDFSLSLFLSLPSTRDSRLSFFRFLSFLFSLSSPRNRFSYFSVFPPAQLGFVTLRATCSRAWQILLCNLIQFYPVLHLFYWAHRELL